MFSGYVAAILVVVWPLPALPSGRDVPGQQLVPALPADDERGVAAAGEHHRDPAGAVVVVRHRVAVRPGHRDDEQVPDARLAERDSLAEHVARLAVPAHHGDLLPAADPVGDRGLEALAD